MAGSPYALLCAGINTECSAEQLNAKLCSFTSYNARVFISAAFKAWWEDAQVPRIMQTSAYECTCLWMLFQMRYWRTPSMLKSVAGHSFEPHCLWPERTVHLQIASKRVPLKVKGCLCKKNDVSNDGHAWNSYLKNLTSLWMMCCVTVPTKADVKENRQREIEERVITALTRACELEKEQAKQPECAEDRTNLKCHHHRKGESSQPSESTGYSNPATVATNDC